MGMKLYVGGLAYAITDKQLEELFAEHGAVTSVTIIKDRDSGQSKGFGFVEMKETSEAEAAIKELDGKDVSGRKINVNQARERDDSAPRGGSGGGSFRRTY